MGGILVCIFRWSARIDFFPLEGFCIRLIPTPQVSIDMNQRIRTRLVAIPESKTLYNPWGVFSARMI